ncbi:MAG: helix-turn-helix domain-containing protein [Deltaproteobacteria bacterium]|nr:helix-turn-helix domain-containing protein [Deltaproteobacteria bacterium]
MAGHTEDHYRALEVPTGASQDEIRNAYRRLKESVISPAELASESIDDAERARHRRIEVAYDVLSDPDRRARYDREIGISDDLDEAAPASVVAAVVADEALEGSVAAAAPRAESFAERVSEPSREVPDIPEDAEIDGPMLKKIRESRGLDLRQVATITKIGFDHLQHLEEERFKNLPAVVYVRGFLSAYARVLKLDVKRVTGSYLKRFESYLSTSRR